jgi:ribose transport system substrate-binding protein
MDRTYARLFAAAAAVALAVSGVGTAVAQDGGYHIGVSNTLQGNGWREEMLCSMRAEAKVSGLVDQMTVLNRNTDTNGQIEDLRTLIAADVDAIVLNPTDRAALNEVIKEATDQGIVVVAVDQAVDEESAFVLSNDQVEYGYLGMKWLAEQLGGEGKVVYMRGIEGVPADTDRDVGVKRALEEFPGIEIVSETFTGWAQAPAAEQIQAIFNSGEEFDGIWTSGIDSTIVDAFKAAGQEFVPIVGADNNAFVGQLVSEAPNGLVGAAVTNPPPVGGAGVALALQALQGSPPAERLQILTPAVWDNTTEEGQATLAGAYNQALHPYYGVNYTIPDWTSYGFEDLVSCQGPAA